MLELGTASSILERFGSGRQLTMKIKQGDQSARFCVVLGAVFMVSTCIKVLLIPSYRSTDFDVHRNWLAITHSLPLSQWYYDTTSQWTLDYPPLFAWFEWVLSQPAALVDPLIVTMGTQGPASSSCVLYQRFTVICSDLTLFYALHQYHVYQTSRSHDHARLLATKRAVVVSMLVLLNCGLFLVDHIHFQYNGFLFGILLLSVVRILQGRHLEGGFWFSVLLNLKHIFLYLSPAYFIYLLKHFCFVSTGPGGKAPPISHFLPHNLLKLGGVVVAVFLVSFGPFMGQLSQVLGRLFPIKRGLCHAYWAPNVWALYSFTDMLSSFAGQRLGLLDGSCDVGTERCGSMTSGLVGEMRLKVLPDIPPWVTVMLTWVSIMPILVKVWWKEESCPNGFLKLLVLCAYSSFLFGWHVHEKAVLLITIPMSFLAVEETKFSRLFIFVSMVAHMSLFPLLHQPAETAVKLCLFVMCTCMKLLSFGPYLSLPPTLSTRASSELSYTDTPADGEVRELKEGADGEVRELKVRGVAGSLRLSWSQSSFLAVLFLVQIYCELLHGIGPLRRFEFLPLLLTSVSCAMAIVYSWGHFMILFFL